MKKQKGITLVALVITIIVLLILAGVSLSLVVGNGGILTQASSAVVKQEAATALEEVQIAAANAYTNYSAAKAEDVNAEIGDYYNTDKFKSDCVSVAEGSNSLDVTVNETNDKATVKYIGKSNKEYIFSINLETNVVKDVSTSADN